MALRHHFIYIMRDAPKLLLPPPRVSARDIVCDQQRFPLLVKRGSGIDLIIRRLAAQKPLIVLDRQQRRREQDRTPSLLHALAQVARRVDAEELQHKIPVVHQLAVHHIMVVHDLVHIEEMRHLEIKFQQFFFVRKGIMLIQEIVDRSIETVQRRHKSIDPLLPAITLTLPFHGEQIPVAPVKIPCDLRVRLLHQPLCAQEIVLEQRGAVHIPAAVEQIVRLVDQEYIVLLSDTVRKKTLEIYPRIEHIIIVADHGIAEQTHVQAELERADLIARRVLLYFFPRKMILVRQQVIQGVIDPVKMTVRIGTCVRIALRFGHPVIQRIFRLKSLLPQKTDRHM